MCGRQDKVCCTCMIFCLMQELQHSMGATPVRALLQLPKQAMLQVTQLWTGCTAEHGDRRGDRHAPGL